MRRRHRIGAGVHEQEAAGAVGRLRLPGLVAALAEQCRLLVAGDARDRDARAEQLRLPHRLARVGDARQQRAIDAEHLEQLAVPLERPQVREQRARRIRPVGDVDVAARQLPHQPAVDGAERKPLLDPCSRSSHSSFVAEKYGSGTRPVCSRISSGSSSRHRSAVRRSCQTIAGATAGRVARSQSTVVSRWLVIPIASRSAATSAGVGQGPGCGREHALPDLLRVVLDPAGPRKVLGQLAGGASCDLECLVDHEARRPRRALVDREDHE